MHAIRKLGEWEREYERASHDIERAKRRLEDVDKKRQEHEDVVGKHIDASCAREQKAKPTL